MLLTLLGVDDSATTQYFVLLNAIVVLCASVYVVAASYEVIGRMALRFVSLVACNRARKDVSHLGDDDGV